MPEQAPQFLGPYRILDVLGQGGMGVVYSALHGLHHTPAAVKTVHVPDRRRMDCIRREIHALQRVHHPGVVRILDAGVEEGTPWYAMPLMEGRTLRDQLNKLWRPSFDPSPDLGSLPTLQVSASSVSAPHLRSLRSLDFVDDIPPIEHAPEVANGDLVNVLTALGAVARTLAFIHGLGLVHGDLKPDNVFLEHGDTPVIVDFGLASQFAARRSREVIAPANLRAGTYAYMAPEQIRGELVDARADLYALGVLLYEGITGRVPFTRGSLLVMHQHLHTRPIAPDQLVRNIHPELNDLILALLAKSPNDRPGHADDIAAQLARLGGLHAEPPTNLQPRPYLYRAGFAGREQAIQGAMELLPNGQHTGGFLLVGGESGVGKTRFAMELTRHLDLPHMEVITGECLPLTGQDSSLRGAPLHPLRTLFTALADRCLERGAEETDVLLGARGKRLARFAPLLAHVPGMATYPEPAPVPDDVARLQVVNDVRATLRAFAREGCLILILDDLQWADELTFELLLTLDAAWLQQNNLLLIGTYRVEEPPPRLNELRERTQAALIRLERLGDEAVGGIVADMLAIKQPPQRFVDFLATQAEGNPFFVAEYLRTAIAEGVVCRDLLGRWQLAANSDAFQALSLPGAIQELVARRLVGLAPQAFLLVQRAAVFGRDVEADLLAAVVDGSDADLLDSLEDLRAAWILEETESGRYRFVHDKLREGALDSIPAADRQHLHRRAAEAIEHAHADSPRLAFHAAALVHHWRIANVTDRLANALEIAGDTSLDSVAYGDALRFFQEALSLNPRDAHADAPRRARWARRAGRAAFSLGDLETSEQTSALALNLLGHPLPTSEAAWGLALLKHAAAHTLHATGVVPLNKHLPSEQQRSDLREATLAAALLAERFYFQNNAPALFSMALLAVNLGEIAAFHDREGTPFAWLGFALGTLRLEQLSTRYFHQAYENCQRAQDTHAFALCKVLESVSRIGNAQLHQAALPLVDALNVVDQENDPQTVELIDTCQGHVDFYAGRFRPSMERFAAVTASATRRDNIQHLAWGLFSMGRALIPLGELDEALKHLLDGLERIRQLGDPASELITQGLLAEANLRLGDRVEARVWADRTFDQIIASSPTAFSTLNGCIGAANVYLDLLNRRQGDQALAEERATRCAKALRTLGFMFPLARPTSLIFQGKLLHTLGKTAKAQRVLQSALDASTRLQLPFEVATARTALALTLPTRERQREQLLGQSWSDFTRLGCPLHLRELEQHIAALR